MRTIIAGSRTVVDYAVVKRAIANSHFIVTEVVSGTARGVDRFGEQWAAENQIAVKQFKPDWDGLGRSAGYRRNEDMAEYACAVEGQPGQLIAVWVNGSKGTGHMIDLAREHGLAVFVVEF